MPDVEVATSAFTSADRIKIPDGAVELLRNCMNEKKNGNPVAERLRAAILPICEEAHRKNAMPEQVLITVKELCHTLPEYEKIRGARERNIFLETVIKMTIEEYYRG
ncbi:MAG: hypothetical protein ABR582_13535 [Gemmatimonadaceae bacterium]